MQIEKNEKKIAELNTLSLKKIFEEIDINDVLSDEVKNNKFLIFLLRNGYLDENYADYINYFHPNSITRDEMNFIIGIRTYESVGDWAFELKNLDQIVDRIENHEFSQQEVLNYFLVDFMITKRYDTEKYNTLMKMISNRDEKSISFIKKYIERGINVESFIRQISKVYHELWIDIEEDNSVSEETKYKYLSMILKNADMKDIEKMDSKTSFLNEYLYIYNGSVRNFIIADKESLKKLSTVPVLRMKEVIEKLSIYFKDLDVEQVQPELLDFIFENGWYDINANMIERIFEMKFPNRLGDLNRSNYTTICEEAYKPLINEINYNFETYVKQVVLALKTNTNENISAVEDMLKKLYNKNLKLCFSLLDKEIVVWNDLEECCAINDENKESDNTIMLIWNHVIELRKTLPKWKNFCTYYTKNGLTSCLLSWLDNEIDKFLQDESTELISDEIVKSIIIENISISSFEKFIKKFKVQDFTNDLSEFDADKVSVMVRIKYLPFSIKFLDEMKDIAPHCRIEYILNNKDEFIKEINSVVLSINEVTELLKSKLLSEFEKKRLFSIFSAKDMNYEMAMVIRELEFLIEKIFVNAAWNLLSTSERYQILLNQIKVYELDEISDKFGELEPMYQKLGKRTKHKVTLPIDEYNYNHRLVSKLKEIGYVTSIDEESYEEKDLSTNKKAMKNRIVVWVKQK